mmetsp:Transcript_39503/g.113639  ORF Transcript_39503/g.113639 Transcript_39503/m.113639 type:complete len:220 (-) Transcript_39503:701-1360(-)
MEDVPRADDRRSRRSGRSAGAGTVEDGQPWAGGRLHLVLRLRHRAPLQRSYVLRLPQLRRVDAEQSVARSQWLYRSCRRLHLRRRRLRRAPGGAGGDELGACCRPHILRWPGLGEQRQLHRGGLPRRLRRRGRLPAGPAGGGRAARRGRDRRPQQRRPAASRPRCEREAVAAARRRRRCGEGGRGVLRHFCHHLHEGAESLGSHGGHRPRGLVRGRRAD